MLIKLTVICILNDLSVPQIHFIKTTTLFEILLLFSASVQSLPELSRVWIGLDRSHKSWKYQRVLTNISWHWLESCQVQKVSTGVFDMLSRSRHFQNELFNTIIVFYSLVLLHIFIFLHFTSLVFLFIHSLFFHFHYFVHSFIFIPSFSFFHSHFSSRTSCWKAHWRLTTCRASWPSSLLPTVPWGSTPGQKTTTLFSITWVQKCFVIIS